MLCGWKLQFCNRTPQGEQGNVRVSVRRQPWILVAHQFHRLTLRHTGTMKVRAERMPERVKIRHPALIVQFLKCSRPLSEH